MGQQGLFEALLSWLGLLAGWLATLEAKGRLAGPRNPEEWSGMEKKSEEKISPYMEHRPSSAKKKSHNPNQNLIRTQMYTTIPINEKNRHRIIHGATQIRVKIIKK